MNPTASLLPLPSLYVSHGSPMIALEPGDAGRFYAALGRALDGTFGRPKAIVGISPHTATRQPLVLGAARHEAIHDFGGFPEALYRERYDAPGSPVLAWQVAALLTQAGIATQVHPEGGLDHGFWTVFKHMWPAADVPVVPLTLQPQASPQAQWRIGQALAPLAAEGVLVVGTGSITHNLRRFFGASHDIDAPVTPDTAAFTGWVAERAAQRDWPALLDYRRQAPHAADAHPTDEHWLPFYVAAGVGGEAATPQRLYDGVTYGMLAMDSYAFGPGAAALRQALGA